MNLHSSGEDYKRIEKAILYLEKNAHQQPDLKDVARAVNLSEYHFQRLFRRWAGISPKRFLQFLTLERVKTLMKGSSNLLDITYQSGLSSSGRLHDLFVNVEAVTPGEFRGRGENLKIRYGFYPSPFGECLIAVTDRGITNLAFVQPGSRATMVRNLKKQWKRADVTEDAAATKPYMDKIFAPGRSVSKADLFVKGTNFQINVWKALLRIPRGAVISYEDMARQIGMPKAVRAVAGAVASNPIAYLIPCHRVILKSGALGGYRWSSTRKKAILAWETSRVKKPGGKGVHFCNV
jgi:AraC family transcriptional regulator, regulatory protein of adaptative response / methylated-DNA-[protein]-cysteine methyltransferase